MARLALSDFHVRQKLEEPLLKRIGVNDFLQRHLLPRLEHVLDMRSKDRLIHVDLIENRLQTPHVFPHRERVLSDLHLRGRHTERPLHRKRNRRCGFIKPHKFLLPFRLSPLHRERFLFDFLHLEIDIFLLLQIVLIDIPADLLR